MNSVAVISPGWRGLVEPGQRRTDNRGAAGTVTCCRLAGLVYGRTWFWLEAPCLSGWRIMTEVFRNVDC